MKKHIWAYHCTTIHNLTSISKEGLCKKTSHDWPDRIWFCDNEASYPPLERFESVLLRFPWPDDEFVYKEVDTLDIDPPEYYTNQNIKASKLELLFTTGWIFLSVYQKNTDKYKIRQYSFEELGIPSF